MKNTRISQQSQLGMILKFNEHLLLFASESI